MCKPIYETVDTQIQPHRWQEPETPILDIEPGSKLDEHIRGEVIFEKGSTRVRCADGRFSIWIGEQMMGVHDDRGIIEKFIDRLKHSER